MRTLTSRLGWVMAGVMSLLVVAAIAGIVRAGPLDPPGPPGPTDSVRLPGTPISSIPYTITQPGTYYLTRNVALVTNGDGITVSADDVTIDLMGFTISGPGPTFAGNGIYDGGAAHKNVAVKNGSLASWPDRAIYMSATQPSRFDDLTIRDSGNGLIIEDYAEARNIVVSQTTGVAIQLWRYSTLDGCTVNTASTGIMTAQGVTVAHCTVANATTGIQINQGTHLSGCSVSSTTTGIWAGTGTAVQGCSVYQSTTGVQLGWGAQLTGCTIHDASSAVVAGDGSTVRNCTIYNSVSGMSAGSADVEDNSIESVTGVSGCAISFTGNGGRARGNKIRGAAYGICSASAANLAYQNTFDGIGTAFFSGSITSAPVDYPATFGNAQANIGY